MIVCVCNNVSEHKIQHAVNAGATSMLALRASLGIGNCCGKCNSCTKAILHECQQTQSEHAPVALTA